MIFLKRFANEARGHTASGRTTRLQKASLGLIQMTTTTKATATRDSLMITASCWVTAILIRLMSLVTREMSSPPW